MNEYNSQFYFTISVVLLITYHADTMDGYPLGRKLVKLESGNYLLTAENAKALADKMLDSWKRRGLEMGSPNAQYELRAKIQISDPYSF